MIGPGFDRITKIKSGLPVYLGDPLFVFKGCLMGIIKTLNIIFDYVTKRDDQGETRQRALDGIDLDIAAGSFIAILGHNGSGKSTLARHINALLIPDEGSVYIDGKDTSDQNAVLDIRKTAGMVFQNPDNQIIGSIVEEDVAFGPENLGVPSAEIYERVADSLKAAGIESCRYSSPNRLSGGQKQRVAIAGVMAMKPSCIVLDESTAMLDPMGRRQVLSTVKELNKEAGVTVILITHYMEEAVYADRVIVMENGRIAMDGTPIEVFDQADRIKELHLSLPPAAELAYRLKKEGLPIEHIPLDTDDLSKTLTNIFSD